MAAATCRVSEVAQAASAAAAGFVPARARICAVASTATRVACSHTAFRSPAVRCARPGVARCGVHRCRSLGQLKSGASFPPPYQTGPLSLVASPGSATEYPVTWPGFLTLNRLRTRTPAWSRRLKNSCSLLADAAAVVTCRRSVILGASSRPRRAAFSFSARVGRRAAVRSAGAVEPVQGYGNAYLLEKC